MAKIHFYRNFTGIKSVKIGLYKLRENEELTTANCII